MLVLIKSSPDTADGAIGMNLARDGGSDLVLLQNGVYFAQKDRLGAFPGEIYVLDEDKRLRGMRDDEMDSRAKMIDYDKLIDIITEGDKVVGIF